MHLVTIGIYYDERPNECQMYFKDAQYVLSQDASSFLDITFPSGALLCHDCPVFYRELRDHRCITWLYRGL